MDFYQAMMSWFGKINPYIIWIQGQVLLDKALPKMFFQKDSYLDHSKGFVVGNIS